MKPSASVWRVASDDGKTIYRLQINGITKKNKKQAKTAATGWTSSGEGWNPNNKTELWLLSRSFETPYAFKKWVNEFPFELDVQRDNRGRKSNQ
jgi:hypothetical protein